MTFMDIMNIKDQLINFFTTKYYNNLKYNSRMLAALRIFFERTTKFTYTMSTLGNVYRSSKWSDLKVQNIKLKFQKQSLNMFILVLIVLVSVVFFLKINYTDLSAFWTLPSYFLFTIYDLLRYGYLVLLMLTYSFISKLELLASSVLQSFFSFGKDEEDEKDSSGLTQSNTNAGNWTFKVDDKNINTEWLLVAYRLYRVVHSLKLSELQVPNLYLSQSCKENIAMRLHLLDSHQKFVAIALFLDSQKSFNLPVSKKKSLTSSELQYYLHSSSPEFFKNSSFIVNPEFFNRLNFFNKKTLINILDQNLSLSKQNRWLWKNNILSDKIVLKSTSWTALKKLYGNPILDKNTSNLNIWYSNNLDKGLNFKKLNYLLNSSKVDTSSLSNSVGSLNFFLNINSYESSLFWTAKRYKFIQNLNNNSNKLNFKLSNSSGLLPTSFLYFNDQNLVSNSIIFNYKSSQSGLITISKKLLGTEELDSNVISSKSNVIYDLNKDILSNIDSDFLTYISKDIMLNNNHLNFFTNSV